MGYDNPSSPAVAQVGLKEYDKLVDEAGKETSDLFARYEKYAAAQAWLTDSSLFLPAMSSSGAAPIISRRKYHSQHLILNLVIKVQMFTYKYLKFASEHCNC